MKEHKNEPRKTSKTRKDENQPRRFHIEKLEERIAPTICDYNAHGKLICHGPMYGKGW